MKRSCLKILLLACLLSLATTAISAQNYIGDNYDEQQWWNPADWFDDTPNTWDYNFNWNDHDWYNASPNNNSNDFGNDYYGYGFEDGFGANTWHDNYDYGTW